MMENYVDVAERIRQFRKAFPTGCLRPANPDEPFKLMTIGDREFIVYVAAAYRTPDDPMPAIAVAAEPSVGKTSFTRDSELMNAETSAWGRAIVAALAADTQKIASLDEVRNRQGEAITQSKNEHPANPERAVVGSKARPLAVVADQPIKTTPVSSTTALASDKQRGMMSKVATERGLDQAELLELASATANRQIGGLIELTKSEASSIITALLAMGEQA